MGNREVSADTAINAFLEAIKDAAAENPAFRARLVSALGYTVLYEGAEQFEGADPVKMVRRWSEDAFKRIWNGATGPVIRAVLKTHGLATPADLVRKPKKALIDLLYERAALEAQNDGRL